MGKIEELEQMAATIKNETTTGANTAERVGVAFEKAAEAIKQGAENATITLDSLNEFPSTTQEAINYVKNNGKKAVLTVMDRDFSVGVLNIFADAQAQVLTEIFETRLTLQNDKFVKGHTYGAPVKYWRNYGLKQDYAQENIKRGEWTKWARCEDDTAIAQHSKKLIEIYNGSQRGEQRDLQDVVSEMNSQLAVEKCLYVSFIDDTEERVLYYCNSSTFSSDISDWKKVGESKAKPIVLPFSSIVGNATVVVGSAINGSIVWNKASNKFLCFENNKYYASWSNAEDYGEIGENGVTPRIGVLYFNSAGEAYTWNESRMIPIINGKNI